MSTDAERKLEELLIKDDQLFTAQLRLNQLRRERAISPQDFRVARLRLQTVQDRIAVQIEMIDDDLPVISAPTDQELEQLRQSVAQVEQQIAATTTVEALIALVNTLAGGDAVDV